jgi:hypothetical protein
VIAAVANENKISYTAESAHGKHKKIIETTQGKATERAVLSVSPD